MRWTALLLGTVSIVSVVGHAQAQNFYPELPALTGNEKIQLAFPNTLGPFYTDPNQIAAYVGATGTPVPGVAGSIQISNGSLQFGTPIVPGTGIATWLATPSSANLLAALTTKTGTGSAVFGTGPTVTGLIHGDITGSTQCLQANSAGLVTGTGSGCGGSGGTPGGSAGSIQYNNAGSFGGALITGLVLGNGASAPTAAVAGTNYAAATTGGANTPLFNNGAGGFTNGTRAGNTTSVATTSGALTSGHVAAFDASGNVVDGGSPTGTPCVAVAGSLQYNNAGAFGCATVGTGLDITAGAVTLKVVPNNQAGTTYTASATTDGNKSINMNNASASALTLPTAASAGSSYGTYAYFKAAGGTLNRTGSDTINGLTTPLTLGANQSVSLTSDGTSAWTAAILAASDPSDGGNLQNATVTTAKISSKSGTGTTVVTTTGAQTATKCVTIDSNGNHVADTVSCGGTGTPIALPAIGWISGAVLSVGPVFNATQTTTVLNITGTPSVATGGTTTIAFFKANNNQACASGIPLHTGSFDANGTPNANQTLTLSSTPSDLILASGDRVCFVATGAGWTSAHLGNGAVTVKVSM